MSHQRTGRTERNIQITKERLNPEQLTGGVSNDFAFNLCARACNCRLLAKAPRDEVRTKIHTEATSGAPISRVTSPIGIRIGSKLAGGRSGKKQIKMNRMSKILKNTLDGLLVRDPWHMHVLTYTIHSIGEIWSSKRQILKAFYDKALDPQMKPH